MAKIFFLSILIATGSLCADAEANKPKLIERDNPSKNYQRYLAFMAYKDTQEQLKKIREQNKENDFNKNPHEEVRPRFHLKRHE